MSEKKKLNELMVRQEEGTPRDTGSTEKGTIEKTEHLVSSLQEDLQLLSTYKHFFLSF